MSILKKLIAGGMLLTGLWAIGAEAFTPIQSDPFKAAWRFVWITEEAFSYTDEDFDKIARGFAENGTTHAMSFNSWHYVFNYYNHFDKLAEVCGKFAKAFNKYGVSFTEHHSSIILYYTLRENDSERGKNLALQYWKNYERDMALDSDCHGVELGSLLQVSVRTGEPVFFDIYHNFNMCPNNPDWRRIYFDFLRQLYAEGINGLLADDLGYNNDGCGCEHCRRLFHERTGLTLPPPEQWDEVMADTDSELYLAWQHFRYLSILETRRKIARTYKDLGLQLVDPIYSAWGVAWRCPNPHVVDEYPDLNFIFQECCGGAIRYSWPEYVTDARQRTMIGRWNNAPTMSLYYPEDQQQAEFAWMLCLYSGHLFFAESRANDSFPERPMRDFEKAHGDALSGYEMPARIAIYDSAQGRHLDLKFPALSAGIGEALIFENVPFNYVGFRDFAPELPEQYEVLIVPEIRFLRDEEIENFRRFAARGGRLLWLGESGIRSYDHYACRSKEQLEQLLETDKNEVVFLDSDALNVRFIPRVLVVWAPPIPLADWQRPTPEEIAKRKEVVAYLQGLLTGPRDIVADVPENLLISSLINPDNGGWTVHLLNAVDTFNDPENSDVYRSSDPVPYPPIGAFSVTLRKPVDRVIASAVGNSLYGETVELPVKDEGETITLSVPADTLKTHLVIELQ